MSAINAAAARRRAPRHRRRSRRSPTTGSSPTATPVRWSRPTARSTGSASRASTRRACSARLLDRGAGSFRLGAVRHQPPDRARLRAGDERARDDLEDADRLDRRARRADHGPAEHEDEITPHTRPPADDDADHMLVRTVECLEGSVEVELVCEPVFDYGRDPGRVGAGRRRPSCGRRHGAGQTVRLQTDLALGIEGDRVRAGTCSSRATRLLRALLGRGARRPPPTSRRPRRGSPPRRATGAPGWAGADPGPPLARPDPALRADHQGPHVHADRRDRRRA